MAIRTIVLILVTLMFTACASTPGPIEKSTSTEVDGRQSLSAPTLAETLKGYSGSTLGQRVAAYNKSRPEAQHIECETKATVGSRMKKTLCYFKQSREINERDVERTKQRMNRPR